MSTIETPSSHSSPSQPTMMPGTTTSPSSPVESKPNPIVAPASNLEAEPAPSSIMGKIQQLDVPQGAGTVKVQHGVDVSVASGLETNSQDLAPATAASTSELNVQAPSGTTPSSAGAGVESTDLISLSELTLFPKFPPELRLKIWKDALRGPRIVEIEHCCFEDEWFCPIESHRKQSGLIRANKESREVYLKSRHKGTAHFKVKGVSTQRFGSHPPHCFHELVRSPDAYFDPTFDTLYIGPSTSNYLCITSRSMKSLAAMPWMKDVTTIACEFMECWDNFEDNDDYPFSHLPQLRELIIVVGDVEEKELQQGKHTWRTRTQGELDFIEPDVGPPSVKEVEMFFDDWYKTVPKDKRPKLIVKKALRGGIVPEVITGYRDGHVSWTEEGSEEPWLA